MTQNIRIHSLTVSPADPAGPGSPVAPYIISCITKYKLVTMVIHTGGPIGPWGPGLPVAPVSP